MSKGAAVLTALVAVVFTSSFSIAAENTVIRGVVTDSNGAALSNARILVHWDPICYDNVGVKDIVLTTAQDGTFQSQVQPGLYDVLVSATSFSPTATKVRVDAAQTKVLNFRLPLDQLVARGPQCLHRWQGGALTVEPEAVPAPTMLIGEPVQEGEVRLPLSGFIGYANTGAPVSGMTVECFVDGREKGIGKVITDSKGRFSFPQLGEGRYYLQATKKGLHRIRTVVTATRSSQNNLALTVEPK